VREDDGQRGVEIAVDLDVQRDAVVGGHRAGARRWGSGRPRQREGEWRRIGRHLAISV
jgi:hypothetical protein